MTLCFKHGADWHEKRKHVKLIMETGYEGYGVYTVLLEYLLSAGGVLEISLNELNYLIRCETGLLKRILTNYDLFDVKSMEHEILCISVDWLLKDIEKARKTSKARAESGPKGLQNRSGVKNASELANTVGVPNNEKQEKSNVKQAKSTSKQAIATANATTNAIANAYTHARSVDENNTDDVGCCCTHTRESLRNLLPEMQKDTEWHGSLSAMMRQSNVNLASTDVPSGVRQEDAGETQPRLRARDRQRPQSEQTASTQRKEAQGNIRAGEERRIVALLADYEMRLVSFDCCTRCGAGQHIRIGHTPEVRQPTNHAHSHLLRLCADGATLLLRV